MDKTEGYKTIYSLDNGQNWEEYIEPIKTNQLVNAIIGQKIPIEDSNETITLERYEKMPDLAEDAIDVPAYDYNEFTTELMDKEKYIKIEEAMEGFKIQIQSSEEHSIIFVKADKTTQIIEEDNNEAGIIVPEEARYLKITKQTNKKKQIKYIKEIKVIPSIQFKVPEKGQSKIKVEAKANGYSGEVTYEYYLNGVLKNTSKQNTYQYTGLQSYVEYNIKIIAKDENGNKDEMTKIIRTKSDNNSIIGFITSDRVQKSNQTILQPTKIGAVQYTYDVLYLDKSNIGNYGYYDEGTKTYVITKNMNIGTSNMGKMAVLKCDENLTINSGVTITAATYKEERKGYPYGSKNGEYTIEADVTKLKGLFICCMGTLTNNGTISQTARGTYDTSGENVYLWYNGNESYEYVPAYGGSGGSTTGNNSSGGSGNNGTGRATGGGGSGATYRTQSGMTSTAR